MSAWPTRPPDEHTQPHRPTDRADSLQPGDRYGARTAASMRRVVACIRWLHRLIGLTDDSKGVFYFCGLEITEDECDEEYFTWSLAVLATGSTAANALVRYQSEKFRAGRSQGLGRTLRVQVSCRPFGARSAPLLGNASLGQGDGFVAPPRRHLRTASLIPILTVRPTQR